MLMTYCWVRNTAYIILFQLCAIIFIYLPFSECRERCQKGRWGIQLNWWFYIFLWTLPILFIFYSEWLFSLIAVVVIIIMLVMTIYKIKPWVWAVKWGYPGQLMAFYESFILNCHRNATVPLEEWKMRLTGQKQGLEADFFGPWPHQGPESLRPWHLATISTHSLPCPVLPRSSPQFWSLAFHLGITSQKWLFLDTAGAILWHPGSRT